MKVLCLVVALFLTVVYVTGTPVKQRELRWITNNQMTELEKIISDIPKEDRKDFVKYCLTNVLKEKHEEKLRSLPAENFDQKFNDVNVPLEVSLELYDLVQSTYELTDDQVLQYVAYGPICFPSGCVDPGDIGSLCCPFMVANLPMKHK